MSASQFSCKIMKRFKEQGFCRKLVLVQRQLFDFFLENTNFAYFVSFPLGENLLKQLF